MNGKLASAGWVRRLVQLGLAFLIVHIMASASNNLDMIDIFTDERWGDIGVGYIGGCHRAPCGFCLNLRLKIP